MFEKNWTSNQEGGTRVVRGGLSTIHFLPHVAGSAADRSAFFLLSGVVRDGTRALFTQSRAVRTPIFNQRSRTSNDQEGAPPRVVRNGLPAIHRLPNIAGSAADRSTFFLPNGVVVVGDGPRAHSPPPLHAVQPGGMTADMSKKGFESRRRTSGA